MTESRTVPRAILPVALLVTCAMALSACGSGGGSVASGPGARWDAKDACKTLDKAAVAAATGQAVKSSETSAGSSAAEEAGTFVSTCTYELENGTVVLMTRVSDSELGDAEIEQMRDGGGMLPRGADLPGFGMKAFWTEKTRQIQVIADRKHYFSIVYGPAMQIPGQPAPAPVDTKALVTGLAKKLL